MSSVCCVANTTALALGALLGLACLGCSHREVQAMTVAPDSHIEIESSRRGDLEKITYELTNQTDNAVTIEVVGKSCDCIDAQLARTALGPSQTSVLYLQVRVPLAGTSHGTATLQVAQTGVGRNAHGPSKLMVSYTLKAMRGNGLAIVPSEIVIGEMQQAISPKTISLACYDSGRPLDALFVAMPLMEQVEHQWIVPWTQDGAGGYVAVVSLVVGASIDNSPTTSIRCYVPTDAGLTLEEVIRIP